MARTHRQQLTSMMEITSKAAWQEYRQTQMEMRWAGELMELSECANPHQECLIEMEYQDVRSSHLRMQETSDHR